MTENNYPTIISFYTNTWEYPSHATRLINECKELGLSYHIKELPDTGEWIGNTRLKAQFIYNTLIELKSPILWIDVDGSIYKKPELLKLPTEYDFMGRHQRTGPRRTWHVGTMFFNYNDRTIKLTRLWHDAVLANTGTDEASFEAIWVKYAPHLNITSNELPIEYFNIIDGNVPISNSVISHRLSKAPSKMEMKLRNAIKHG
jgi:hypothetical protein